MSEQLCSLSSLFGINILPNFLFFFSFLDIFARRWTTKKSKKNQMTLKMLDFFNETFSPHKTEASNIPKTHAYMTDCRHCLCQDFSLQVFTTMKCS